VYIEDGDGGAGTVMEVSRGAAYGLGLSQFVITLGIVLFTPPMRVSVYVPRGTLNGTAFQVDAKPIELQMGLPVVGTSFLAAVFALVTCKVHEQGLSGQDYQQDVVDQMGMWDMLFWVFCAASHAVVVLVVGDPADVFGTLSSTAFMSYFLFRACASKGQHVNLTQENFNIMGYGLGVLQAAYQLTETRPNGTSILLVMIVLDYFLGIGHTYDRQATIDTVSNCRIFYICAGALGCAVLYAMDSQPQPVLQVS
jgi:hypothetical protein